MYILGVRVDELSEELVYAMLENYLIHPDCKKRQIATLNPEIVYKASKNAALKRILYKTDLNVADGVGLSIAALLQGKNIGHRVTGVDITEFLLARANELDLNVCIVVREDGLSSWSEIEEKIGQVYPRLRMIGTDVHVEAKAQNLPMSFFEGAHIVLCNFGSPYQEIFLAGLESSTLRVVVGVGGTFDYLTGKVKRAPWWARSIGCEWVFRLLRQPSRFGRIVNAVVWFPLMVLQEKIGLQKPKEEEVNLIGK